MFPKLVTVFCPTTFSNNITFITKGRKLLENPKQCHLLFAYNYKKTILK